MPGFKGVEIGNVMSIREKSDAMSTEVRLFGKGCDSGRDPGHQLGTEKWVPLWQLNFNPNWYGRAASVQH